MPVYYSKFDEEQPVFHVFLGCGEGSKIAVEDRVEKVKKRSICKECLVLMKQASWVQPREESCDHEATDHHGMDHHGMDHHDREVHHQVESRTGT